MERGIDIIKVLVFHYIISKNRTGKILITCTEIVSSYFYHSQHFGLEVFRTLLDRFCSFFPQMVKGDLNYISILNFDVFDFGLQLCTTYTIEINWLIVIKANCENCKNVSPIYNVHFRVKMARTLNFYKIYQEKDTYF